MDGFWFRAERVGEMSENKTKPTEVSVEDFLATISEQRADEARKIMQIMGQITGESAVIWGPSIS